MMTLLRLCSAETEFLLTAALSSASFLRAVPEHHLHLNLCFHLRFGFRLIYNTNLARLADGYVPTASGDDEDDDYDYAVASLPARDYILATDSCISRSISMCCSRNDSILQDMVHCHISSSSH